MLHGRVLRPAEVGVTEDRDGDENKKNPLISYFLVVRIPDVSL
jgi:hypothetical protein